MSRGAPDAVAWGALRGDRYDGRDVTPVVIVHGVMDRAASFRRTARRIETGEIVIYDRRGYARSIEAEVSSDLSSQVDDLGTVLASLGAPALVVGHSQGALIALHALADPVVEPRIAGVIAWEPPMPWERWYDVSTGGAAIHHGVDGAAEYFMRAVIGDDRWERMPPAARADRRAEGPALMADLAASRAESARLDFSAVAGEVLAACGSETSDHSRRSTDTLAAAVPGCRRVVVDGAGHGVHLTHPARFAALIVAERDRLDRR